MIFDTHAHYDDKQFDQDREELLASMKDNGIGTIVDVGSNMETSTWIVEAVTRYPMMYGAVGVHPSDTAELKESDIDTLKKYAAMDRILAIGEIGLDYYWDKSFVDLQKEVYVKQILLANKLNLPIVIHDREAHKDAYDLLLEYNQSSKALFHCFSGSVEFMRECVKKGWYIALGGVVTFKNAVKMKDVAREIPLDKLVLETDSPYLTPVPFRGKPNTPAYVRYVAEEIANLRQIPLNELIDITTNNAERFFEI